MPKKEQARNKQLNKEDHKAIDETAKWARRAVGALAGVAVVFKAAKKYGKQIAIVVSKLIPHK